MNFIRLQTAGNEISDITRRAESAQHLHLRAGGYADCLQRSDNGVRPVKGEVSIITLFYLHYISSSNTIDIQHSRAITSRTKELRICSVQSQC